MSDGETAETQDTSVAASLRAYILDGMRVEQEDAIQRIRIPRFDDRLVLRCHSLPSRELIRIGMVAQNHTDEVEGLIQASITALLKSCDGCETTVDGTTHDLGVKLGLDLAEMLGAAAGCDGAMSDREAVCLIFKDEADIVTCANELQQFQALANARSADEMVGNSEAAR
jgi:hypothetical protein